MPTFNPEKINKLRKVDGLFKSIYMFPRNNHEQPAIVKAAVKEILVMGFFLIGDTLMFLPALRVLKKNYPNAKITLVCEKAVKIILKDQDIIETFVVVKCPWLPPVNRSLDTLLGLYASIRFVKKKHFDLAIDLRGDWRSIFYLDRIKAARKISYNSSGGDYMLTDPIIANPDISHVTEESLYLLKQIGCEFEENDKFPVLNITAEDKVFIDEFKADNQLQDKFVIGIHPGASQEVKRWDEKKYSELIVRLSISNPNSSFLIFEGPNEHETVENIEHVLKENHIIDYKVVSAPLHEYILLISVCGLMICNDSGAAHIAAAFSVPVLIIFGNVDPKYVSPYGSNLKRVISHNLECKPCLQTYCRFGHNLCIAGVTTEEVYNTAIDMISILKSQHVIH